MPKRKNKRRQRNDKANAVAHPNQRAQSKTEEVVFEDAFEDVFEEEDVNMGGQAEVKRVHFGEEKEKEKKDVVQRVWQPNEGIGENMQLEYDCSAYKAFHRMKIDWPCLSFDVIPDGLGQHRVKYPHTVYLAAGTQADQANHNHVKLLKISDLHKTQNDDNSDSEDDPDDLDDDPILEEKRFAHPGGINRLRCLPQQPSIIATQTADHKVHVWDAKEHLSALDRPPMQRLPKLQPMYTFNGQIKEGFALDWSPQVAGRLLTGDCASNIYLWEPSNGTWNIDSKGYTDHTDSVEDLQWSPTEATVFASCSADKTIRIWDTRAKQSQLWVAAHKQDVNVIHWNRKQAHLLVSGSDDGSVKVWDLRSFASSTPAAHFKWHNAPITSVQWHPTDESVFAAACADNSISFWDMGLEFDTDLPGEGADCSGMEIPSQLLFIHRGQSQIKEVHWHKQVPGMLEEHFEGKFLENQGENSTSSTSSSSAMQT